MATKKKVVKKAAVPTIKPAFQDSRVIVGHRNNGAYIVLWKTKDEKVELKELQYMLTLALDVCGYHDAYHVDLEQKDFPGYFHFHIRRK